MARINNEKTFVEKYFEKYPDEKTRMEQDEEKRKKKRKTINSTKMKFLCQCKSGHIFDYRERIKYPEDDYHYSGQGKCPYCGNPHWYNVYHPIKFNYVG